MFPSTLIIELTCFLFSISYLRKRENGYWLYFIWFMLFISLIEGTGWAMAVFLHKKNHWLYKLALPIEVFFIGWMIFQFCRPYSNSKPWFIAGLAVFTISYLIEIATQQFSLYADFTASLVSILFVIASCSYFFLLLKDKNYLNLLKHAPFWIMAGIFLFYFGSTAVNIFFEELMKLNITKGISLRYFIFTVLNGILYGCWIYAFRCKYQQTILLS